MPRTAAFEAHHQRHDAWFEQQQAACVSELPALRPFVPWEGWGWRSEWAAAGSRPDEKLVGTTEAWYMLPTGDSLAHRRGEGTRASEEPRSP